MKIFLKISLLLIVLVFISYAGLAFAPSTGEGVKKFFNEVARVNFSKNKESEIKILFVGDVMLDRSIRKRAENFAYANNVSLEKGYESLLECVRPIFQEYDFVVANLEAPVTDYGSVSVGTVPAEPNNYRFTISPVAVRAMKNVGVNVVGIGNNHILDFGQEGLESTRKYLSGAGFNYFGDPRDKNKQSIKLEKDEIVFNLVAFNEFLGSVEGTLNEIKNISENEKGEVIVFAHWGDEYVPASDRQKKWAREFVLAGADAVIGAHPHVAQETGFIDGRFVVYSLGNFIFDQYWNEEVKNGQAIEIVINNNGEVKEKIFNVRLDENRRPCIIK